MPSEMRKISIDYVMDKASGPHFSGLHAPTATATASYSPFSDTNDPNHPFVIGVSGGTASGKTTVCDLIIQQLHDYRVVLVNQDSFYRGLTAEELKCVHEYNFDHPDAFDTEQLLYCVLTLKSGQCSGILVFHDQRVRNLMNMKIFVDTDDDVRLSRRIKQDTVERGRDVSSVLEQYAKFVKPAFDDFVLPSKKYADVIIPRGGENHVAIDLIVQHIRTKLGQHDLCKIYPNAYIIQSTFQVVEHGLGHLPFTEKQVITPTGSMYTGVDFCKKLCGVSIVRSGESMENALRACCKGIKIGKILIHRDGDDGKQLIYEKLPKDISERHVLLLDPVLATGNSANHAIELLIQKGVPESHIIFLNLISVSIFCIVGCRCIYYLAALHSTFSFFLSSSMLNACFLFPQAPEGIHRVCKRFPSLKIVTSEIDVALNGEFRVIPGMGEFGDRYFGTDD
ncbi:hypothetical protein V6N13_133020 [Hibiscus sabdariffa]